MFAKTCVKQLRVERNQHYFSAVYQVSKPLNCHAIQSLLLGPKLVQHFHTSSDTESAVRAESEVWGSAIKLTRRMLHKFHVEILFSVKHSVVQDAC